MFCPHCGHPNEEGDNFCRSCGKRLTNESAPAAPTDAPEFRTEADFSVGPSEETPRAGGSAFFTPGSVKSAFASSAILVALIAYSAAACSDLIGLFQRSSFIYGAFVNDVVESVATVSATVSSLFFIVPEILIVIGSWITYASLANRHTWAVKTEGLSVIRVALIIQLVLLCVVLGFIEVVLLMMLSVIAFGYSIQDWMGGYAGNAMDGVEAIFFMLTVIITAVFVLAIIYYVKTYKMVGVMRNTAATGVPDGRISSYVIAMQFILGGCIIFNILRTLLYGGVVLVMSGICSATAAISFGVFLHSYRTKMRRMAPETLDA